MIVQAHRDGDVDLSCMSSGMIAVEFDCSTHTANTAKKFLGIEPNRRSYKRPFQEDEKWNTERRDYLESWGRKDE